jgi:hypothetical protein
MSSIADDAAGIARRLREMEAAKAPADPAPRFADLEWEPHHFRPDWGDHAWVEMPNGWAISFLRGSRFSIHMDPACPYYRGPYEALPFCRGHGAVLSLLRHGDAKDMQDVIDLVARRPAGEPPPVEEHDPG